MNVDQSSRVAVPTDQTALRQRVSAGDLSATSVGHVGALRRWVETVGKFGTSPASPGSRTRRVASSLHLWYLSRRCCRTVPCDVIARARRLSRGRIALHRSRRRDVTAQWVRDKVATRIVLRGRRSSVSCARRSPPSLAALAAVAHCGGLQRGGCPAAARGRCVPSPLPRPFFSRASFPAWLVSRSLSHRGRRCSPRLVRRSSSGRPPI